MRKLPEPSRFRSLKWTATAAALALPVLGGARPALALQPLDEFVAAAKAQSLDNREAQATAAQRAEEARQAWGRIGPSLSAKGTYTRNQYDSSTNIQTGPTSFTTVTIAPYDQLDAVFALNLPLVDVGGWQRIGGAAASADAARLRAQGTALEVEKGVVRAYYQVVAAEATLAAAERALATASESRAIVATRREAGAASDLDVERARAAVERQRQIVATAEQGRAVARRSLSSLAGLAPSEGSAALPDDGLGEEPALATLEPAVANLPGVRAAALDTRAADRSASAAWAALAPTVTASATERLSNATGFTGHVSTWAVGVTAAWSVDASAVYAARAQGAARAVADVREKRAAQQARDELHGAFQEVRAGLAKVRAARAEAEASARAARLARDRYQAGAATQLDVQQAERDAFAGEVARIQAQADLAYARAAVRLDSGRAR
jgi:outer membrane protein TolC